MFYRTMSRAAELAVDPARLCATSGTSCPPAVSLHRHRLRLLRPALFSRLGEPLPFGISPQLLLRFLDATWSERGRRGDVGVRSGRDCHDQSLATLVWLVEYVLLKRYEKGESYNETQSDWTLPFALCLLPIGNQSGCAVKSFSSVHNDF